MEFKEYLAIIRRRWLLFFPIFALIVGAHLFWINYAQQDRYAAVSKLIISEDLGLAASKVALPIGLPDVSMLTKEATITDYPVLRRAAELSLGLREFQSPEFRSDKIKGEIEQYSRDLATLYGNSDAEIEELVGVLQGVTQVRRPGDRQIVEIHVEGDHADHSLLFSWAMAEAAHQYHNEKARSSIDEFLVNTEKLIVEATEEQDTAHAELRETQKALGISNFGDKERMILENLYRIDREEDNLRARSRKNDRLIQHRLEEQSFRGRFDVGRNVQLESEGRVGEIRRLLFQKKLDLDTKITTLAAKHPHVQQLRASIASLEKAMAKEQDSVLMEKYKHFSRETNDFIKDNALIRLELDVLAESRDRLQKDLRSLNSKRQDFMPREVRFKQAQERLASLTTVRKQMSWIAEGNLGGVSVYDPAIMVTTIATGGAGFGPITLTVLMAFIFALGVVYIVEYVDTRMKSEHDVRRHLNLPLLGVIPRIPGSSGLLTEAPPESEISEKFNTAATLIQSVSKDLNIKSIMVGSAIAREGKTTVSVNLSVALARKGARVVLVDGDLRLSQVHNVLRMPNSVGLTSVLDARLDPSQIIEGVMTEDDIDLNHSRAMSRVQKSSIEGLDVLTAGPNTGDPVTLLDSVRLTRLVAELKQHYDFVIFDSPPINKVGDALTLATVVDGVCFVVGSGQAEQHDVSWAKHLLANVQANVLGVFLNKFAKQGGRSEYYYYYYNRDKRKKQRA